MNQTHYAICTPTMLFEVVVLYLIAVFAASENASHWILWFKILYIRWCNICKDFNKEINVDVVMHTNTKLPLLWKLLLCCQDKHFHFMDAS